MTLSDEDKCLRFNREAFGEIRSHGRFGKFRDVRQSRSGGSGRSSDTVELEKAFWRSSITEILLATGYVDELATVSLLGVAQETLKVSLGFHEPKVEAFTLHFRRGELCERHRKVEGSLDWQELRRVAWICRRRVNIGFLTMQRMVTDNAAPTVTRTVYSIANTEGASSITFTLGRESPYSLVYPEGYVESGATATYVRHKDKGEPYQKTVEYSFGESNETGVVHVVSSTVEVTKVNKSSVSDEPYVVTYQVWDEFGNMVEKTMDVSVWDLGSPSITAVDLNGTVNPTVEAGQPYVDPGFYYSDNYWDLATDFNATVTYFNKAGSVVRTVQYPGNETPYVGGSSIEADDSISTWDLSSFGTFTVQYRLTDKSWQYSDFNRTVTVVDRTAPTLRAG